MTFINMTWENVEEAIGRILEQLKEIEYIPLTIIAVAKGGVIPAALIHQAYPLAAFHTMRVKSYAHEMVPKDPEIIGTIPSPTIYDDPGTLIVDDILDSGGTYRHIRRLFPNATYAFMSVRDKNVSEAPIRGWIWGRGWVVFPWEKVEEVILPF